MRTTLPMLAVMLLAACASPAERMTIGQVSSLTDAQLCQINNGYRAEPKTMAEIGRRGLNCDPAAAECMAQGITQDSPMLALCMSTVNAEWQGQYFAQAENARRDYAMYQLGTEDNTQHIYINQ